MSNPFVIRSRARTARLARLVGVAASVLAGIVLGAWAATPAHAAATPERYIVVLEAGHDPLGVARLVGARPRHVYTSALNGFAAELNERQVEALRRSPRVDFIERDQRVSGAATQAIDSSGQPWGLDRIDQRFLPLSRSYSYTRTGSGVRVYVLDTGIDKFHSDFQGRALNPYDAITGTGGSGQDCHGHGTHVAGTIGGAIHGVAKLVELRAVRVLNCNNSGSWSDIIEGIDWVRANHIKPAVANLSLGGGGSAAVDTAVTNLVNAGVFVAVAGMNSNMDACNVSPARASAVYAVAASDSGDGRWTSSNFGPCIDGYAPGVNIRSARAGGGTTTMSGTSMATPHVVGTAALVLSRYPTAAPSFVRDYINQRTTQGVIRNNPAQTVNRLLHKPSADL